MAKRKVRVTAPASSANLGAGFDIFALALNRPRDLLTMEKRERGIKITTQSPGMPEAPERNVAWAVAKAILRKEGVRGGVAIYLEKGVPVGAGLGSSAASSVGTVVGIDSLYGLGLSELEMIEYAGVGEKFASGTAHYDNVAASLAGGFVIVNGTQSITRMEPPRGMRLCLVTPKVKLPEEKTKYARKLLPKKVPLAAMVHSSLAASMMVHGFATGNVEEIGKAMAASPVDESRAEMIPKFEEVRRAALAQGAAGVCISGAGPTLLAVAERRTSQRVLKAMVKAFRAGGIESSGFVTGVGRGCEVVGA